MFRVQFKPEDMRVFRNSGRRVGLWNHSDPSLQMPAEDQLGNADPVFVGKANQRDILEDLSPSQGRPGLRHDFAVFVVPDQRLLGEPRVEFDLVDHGSLT